MKETRPADIRLVIAPKRTGKVGRETRHEPVERYPEIGDQQERCGERVEPRVKCERAVFTLALAQDEADDEQHLPGERIEEPAVLTGMQDNVVEGALAVPGVVG